jgi:hypothetical protein
VQCVVGCAESKANAAPPQRRRRRRRCRCLPLPPPPTCQSAVKRADLLVTKDQTVRYFNLRFVFFPAVFLFVVVVVGVFWFEILLIKKGAAKQIRRCDLMVTRERESESLALL